MKNDDGLSRFAANTATSAGDGAALAGVDDAGYLIASVKHDDDAEGGTKVRELDGMLQEGAEENVKEMNRRRRGRNEKEEGGGRERDEDDLDDDDDDVHDHKGGTKDYKNVEGADAEVDSGGTVNKTVLSLLKWADHLC